MNENILDKLIEFTILQKKQVEVLKESEDYSVIIKDALFKIIKFIHSIVSFYHWSKMKAKLGVNQDLQNQ